MKFKKGLIFALFLLMGILLGSVLTEIAQKVSFLHFLTWGKSIGIGVPNPITIDLSVLTFSIGFSLQMNLALLICIIGSLIFYSKVGKNI
ncbi:DUF4321 domain-containing protein [Massiliimalia massiliensis]|jgi:hypothetical protein|uniref:DUF4321 domain-containing protein n=1 Tax=Massiliimalia massiliensis TaxID=1852384 RepID=UPI00098753CC|nr:DUF4321 domain-containing protein [Massiliimalia massiliensis]